jgi:DNA-binding MarR family transcriptional regulator
MGASSYEDIVRETCIDIASVKAVVDDLVSQGMVKREPTVSGPNGGRPVIFLSLIDIVFD